MPEGISGTRIAAGRVVVKMQILRLEEEKDQ
jgi:hypothetical protein